MVQREPQLSHLCLRQCWAWRRSENVSALLWPIHGTALVLSPSLELIKLKRYSDKPNRAFTLVGMRAGWLHCTGKRCWMRFEASHPCSPFLHIEFYRGFLVLICLQAAMQLLKYTAFYFPLPIHLKIKLQLKSLVSLLRSSTELLQVQHLSDLGISRHHHYC